ncbi:hypothetical protein [Rhizobium sp. LC145]|uniref:hypothetical protein n=1 Tax=Rhizobium sp. LC145 TaxID=1120688 RepID=UPI0010CA060C|nr:hypothetical protein [Rhizobium sp. LC145]TKT45338.1 hypothetical protein FDR95_25715 [Rhizobiaceae bacterium LC148]
MNYETFKQISYAFSSDGVEPDAPNEMINTHQELAQWLNGQAVQMPSDNRFRPLSGAARIAAENVIRSLNQSPITAIQQLQRVARERTRKFMDWQAAQETNPDVLAAIIAAYVFETRRLQYEPNTRSQDLMPAVIGSELASYASWKNVSMAASSFEEQVGRLQDELRANSTQILNAARDQVQSASETVIGLQKSNNEALQSLDETKKLIDGTARESAGYIHEQRTAAAEVHAKIDEAEAKLAAVQESIGSLSAKKLWDQRAASSRWSFWLSAGLIAFLLLIIPGTAIYYLDWTLETLRHIGEATMQGLPPQPTDTQLAVSAINRLVVITLPIVLYLWVVRLVVRFNLQSLLLLDDAKQRHTMMDTYFHLLEQQAALKEDRALVLAALFRPTPGHGPDNVEPPNFTELLDKATGR